MRKRILAAALSLCLVLSLLPTAALAYTREGDETPTSGYCGGDTSAAEFTYRYTALNTSNQPVDKERTVRQNLEWEVTLNEDGQTYTLNITGTGDMADFDWDGGKSQDKIDYPTYAPWCVYDYSPKITEIHIGDKVTSVGSHAFRGMTNLEEVYIPASVVKIGSGVFHNSTVQRYVVDANNPNYMSDDAGVLYNKDQTKLLYYPMNSSLESYMLPSTVTEIGYVAFAGATLKHLNMSQATKLEKIGQEAFSAAHLQGNVVLPESAFNLGTFAFNKMSEATVVVTAPSIKVLNNTFCRVKAVDLSKVNQVVTANENVKGNTVFDQCQYIFVDSEDMLTSVRNTYSFNRPVFYLAGGAFASDADYTTDAPVKDGYVFAGWYAKDDAGNFTGDAVTVSAATGKTNYYAKWENGSGFCGAENNVENITWKLTANKEDTSTYTMTISGTGAMADYAAKTQPWNNRMSSITRVVIENGVERIGQRAFQSAPNLRELTLNGNVVIGDRAFHEVTLEKINGQKYITKIEGRAFKSLNVETLDLSNVTEIGEYAFEAASGLKSITVSDKLLKIKDHAFIQSGLTELNIPNHVVIEGGTALFYSCENLKFVHLPETLTSIPDQMFQFSNVLETVNIPSTVTAIGQHAFNSVAVKAFVLPNLTLIGQSAFKNLAEGSGIYVPNKDTVALFNAENYSTDKSFLAVTNGGTFPKTAEFKLGVFTEPVMTGFKFGGWYENEDCSGTAVVTPTAGKTYYAKWAEKAERIAPAAPTLQDRSYTSITLDIIEGAQYRCNGGEWQTSPEFTGLTAGTAYTFEAHYPETDDYKASPVSATAEISTLRRSSGSSSSGSGNYIVSVPGTKNGDVTVSPKTAKKGDTVTITVTPDKGYELDTITVKDADGNTVKLTNNGNGTYSFTMPGGDVSIAASFTKAGSTAFRDVPANAYFAKAVRWAVDKNITTGTGEDTFSPDESCTRAQMAVFLWRAAGSPEPKAMSRFADVPEDAYYAKAVAWAVENGITTGTGENTFSPEETCTRAQMAALLYRHAKTPAVTGNAPFADTPSDAYYYDAVRWAVEKGVTTGTSETTFSPDDDCTRAQIVTFLYRAEN